MKDPFDIIQNVYITEKTTNLGASHNQVIFRVHPTATKVEIKNAVEKIFEKKVVSVNTMQVAGRKKRERRADFGRTSAWKKAIVTLKEGDKITLV